jgi:hypothetical protein
MPKRAQKRAVRIVRIGAHIRLPYVESGQVSSQT